MPSMVLFMLLSTRLNWQPGGAVAPPENQRSRPTVFISSIQPTRTSPKYQPTLLSSMLFYMILAPNSQLRPSRLPNSKFFVDPMPNCNLLGSSSIRSPQKAPKKAPKKHTTVGIRWWSPTQLLIHRSEAWVWQSGRDALFSSVYGRMWLTLACLDVYRRLTWREESGDRGVAVLSEMEVGMGAMTRWFVLLNCLLADKVEEKSSWISYLDPNSRSKNPIRSGNLVDVRSKSLRLNLMLTFGNILCLTHVSLRYR